jgi:transposase
MPLGPDVRPGYRVTAAVDKDRTRRTAQSWRIFVDECGANTAMTRTHGRAPAGQRVYTNTPGPWESITLTCGLRLSGVTAALAFPNATNTDMFETDVEEVLVPELKPGDVVIWDNLKPHRSEEANEVVEAAGARVAPLSPWSPDLTPIEEMVSKVKGATAARAELTRVQRRSPGSRA